ncbi:MAG: phytoene desaturase family protein [Thermaceae bacterium]
MRAVVLGAGVGGLSAAWALAKAGLEVTVLEAQAYPGGLAGTFFHRGFLFDAGATLLGGLELMEAAGIPFSYPPLPEGSPLIRVKSPYGEVTRPVGRESEEEALASSFGREVRPFLKWQGERAERLWRLAPHLPFPPAHPKEGEALLKALPSLLPLLPEAFLPLSRYTPKVGWFPLFLQGQALISAQTVDPYALYGAAAFDLPHRGVALPQGGMGEVSRTLERALSALGGRVLYRHRVVGFEVEGRRAKGVVALHRKEEVRFYGEVFLANLPPWDLARLRVYTGKDREGRPLGRQAPPGDAWGAFAVYAGVAEEVLTHPAPYHQWLGEGAWVFLSIAPPGRGPEGVRAVTLSLHTPLRLWKGLSQGEYERLKALHLEAALRGAERLFPGFREASTLLLPATPLTYERFTGRTLGFAGGFPQRHPFRFRSPKTPLENLFLVGEALFPGQSVPAVALGGVRAARLTLEALKV